ncbi:hypothetical protein DSECCO2_544160 [anaerobic digester metagenome]
MINIYQQLIHAQALFPRPGGSFAKHGAGGNGVLVAHGIPNQISITLLTATNKLLFRLIFSYHFSDVLESGEYIKGLHLITVGNVF